MTITLNTKVYPISAIIDTCYAYLGKAYLFLDGAAEKEITVSFKAKHKRGMPRLSLLRDEFLNDLLYATLRNQVSNNNRKITEYIVERALYSATHGSPVASQEDDPLGIAIPWEDRFGDPAVMPKKKARAH